MKKTLFPNYRLTDIRCCYTCKHRETDYEWEIYCKIHMDPTARYTKNDVDIEGICDDYEQGDEV